MIKDLLEANVIPLPLSGDSLLNTVDCAYQTGIIYESDYQLSILGHSKEKV